MNGDERRKKIINILSSSKSPVAGVALAKELDVSRQVIVQDIALLRANGAAIFSTNRGYLIQADKQYSRVLKVVHEDDEVEEELSTIVDAGGHVKDVFVYHKSTEYSAPIWTSSPDVMSEITWRKSVQESPAFLKM